MGLQDSNNDNDNSKDNMQEHEHEHEHEEQLSESLHQNDLGNETTHTEDDTNVFLKPRQDSMSIYTNFMPRLSSATESSIANYLNMENNNTNTNNNSNNTSTTGKGSTDASNVYRGYSIVNNNMYNIGSKIRRPSVSQQSNNAHNNNNNNNNNSTQGNNHEYNGTRRQSEQLEPFIAPMKFKTPNFGSSTTASNNNSNNNNSSSMGGLKRSNSSTPGPASTSMLMSKSKTPVVPSSTTATTTTTTNTSTATNTAANNNNNTHTSTANSNVEHSNQNSPNLQNQLSDLPALRSDSISSILGAAALINQPLQPPSKRNSIFIPTDNIHSSTTTSIPTTTTTTTTTATQSNEPGSMKPPSTTAPTYFTKQQQQQQQQQFQQLLNSNSLGSLYGDNTGAASGNANHSDNIDFDIFNLNSSRKSSFRLGDDFDLSSFRRRNSSVRGTLDLPPLPGSSISNRLRSSSRTFSQTLNHHPLTMNPGTTNGGNNTNNHNIMKNHKNSLSNTNIAHTLDHDNNSLQQQKNSQYSKFLQNNESAISDYDEDDDVDLHNLNKHPHHAYSKSGSQSHAHNSNHQNMLDSRMILRRKSNLRDASLTPIPLTTPPLGSYGQHSGGRESQNQHHQISDGSTMHDDLGTLNVNAHLSVPPTIEFDSEGNIIDHQSAFGTSDLEAPLLPKTKRTRKKTSSSKEKTRRSRKRKSTVDENGEPIEEVKSKKRKSSRKRGSKSSKEEHLSDAALLKDESHHHGEEDEGEEIHENEFGDIDLQNEINNMEEDLGILVKKQTKSKRGSKTKSTRKSRKSTTSSAETTPSETPSKKKKSSKSSTPRSAKKTRGHGHSHAAPVVESLMSQPIIVENPMKSQNGTNDVDDMPVLGATRVDQLMLILQARQKGFTDALETTSDGKINIENAPEIIPPAIELVGGVDKPKTHDLLLNPPPQPIKVEANTPVSDLVSANAEMSMSPNGSGARTADISNAGSPSTNSNVSAAGPGGSPLGNGTDSNGVPIENSAVSTPAAGSAEDSTSVSAPPNSRRKLHICQYCNKQFTQSTHLEVHVRSHIGLKPYVCTYCGKTFTQGGNLRTHIRLHTGEQPFECKVCSKRFSRKGNLQAHALTHEDFRPFHCILDGCDKSFTQLGNLKSHQNKFHLETLNILTMKLAKNDFDLDNEEERKLLEYLSSLYKNSNKGIKGRGKNSSSAVKNPDQGESMDSPTIEETTAAALTNPNNED